MRVAAGLAVGRLSQLHGRHNRLDRPGVADFGRRIYELGTD